MFCHPIEKYYAHNERHRWCRSSTDAPAVPLEECRAQEERINHENTKGRKREIYKVKILDQRSGLLLKKKPYRMGAHALKPLHWPFIPVHNTGHSGFFT
jgi:hypothetical protein